MFYFCFSLFGSSHLVPSFLFANVFTEDETWFNNKRLTHCLRIVSWSLLGFLFCQREQKQNLLVKWKTRLSCHLLYVFCLFCCFLLNLMDILSVPRLLCFFVGFVSCFYLGHLPLFLVTGVLKVCFFSLAHLRPNWGLSLALQRPGKMARNWGSCPVDIWHFSTLLFCAIRRSFYMLASLRSLAMFENQIIVMPRRFKQWYSLWFELSWWG